jgi:hypothetical protein
MAHGLVTRSGKFAKKTVRPPTREPSKEELAEIQAAVKAAGLMPRAAA